MPPSWPAARCAATTHCPAAAKCQSWQARRVVTVLGEVAVARAYYHCRHCRAGHCPRDAALGLAASDLSPGAEQAAALAGALGSFADAAEKVLPRLAGLRLAESTVERAAERAGERAGRLLAAGQTFGPARD